MSSTINRVNENSLLHGSRTLLHLVAVTQEQMLFPLPAVAGKEKHLLLAVITLSNGNTHKENSQGYRKVISFNNGNPGIFSL